MISEEDMKRKRSYGLFALLIFAAFLLFAAIFQKYSSISKQNNLYNVGQLLTKENYIETKAFLVFDEIVYDNFSGQKLNINENMVYRTGQNIDGTNNPISMNQTKVMLNSYKANKGSSGIDYDKAKEALLNNRYADMNFSYFSSINSDEDFSSKTLNYLNQVNNDKLIRFKESGYIVNHIDGYESLINMNNLNDTNFDFLLNSENISIEPILGLKYLNNKKYYFICVLDKSDIKINDLKKIKVVYDNKEINANLESYGIRNNKRILVYKSYDGLNHFKDKRFVDIRLKFDSYEGFSIPKSALFEKDGINGVYGLDNNKIKFYPLSVISSQGDNIFVSRDLNQIFSRALIENINIDRLEEFTKILINPKNFKEGDSY